MNEEHIENLQETPSTDEKAGLKKGKKKYPDRRILFGPMDSQLFFIDIIERSETADGYRVNKKRSVPVRLTRAAVIDGLPDAAGGCSALVHPEMSEDFEVDYSMLNELIEKHRNYGRRFAFIDDKKKSAPILDQMRRQAIKEGVVQMEALTEGVQRSDMALPEDRLL
jgi:hypothetical protein